MMSRGIDVTRIGGGGYYGFIACGIISIINVMIRSELRKGQE
jgi:hypothetical protein